jgi:hypothetical protein
LSYAMLKRIFPSYTTRDGRSPMEELHKLSRDVPYGYWTLLASAFSAARRRQQTKPRAGLRTA